MTKKKIEDNAYIFFPARRHIAILSAIVALCISIDVYYMSSHAGILYKIILAILVLMFIFFLVPVIRNQRIIVSGDKIGISIYCRWYYVLFSEGLYAIVVEADEVVSYRFKYDGQLYQISPKSYIETAEMNRLFSALMKKQKIPPEIISK